MSRAARVAMLLVLALTACNHNKNQVQSQPPLAPPIEDTPPPPPNKAPANLPPPVMTEPSQQPPVQAQETPPPPPPKPKKKKKDQPADEQQKNTEVAQNNGQPQVSAEGNFTPGEPADLRKQTLDSIADTEKGLNAITRKLNDQEQKTKEQVLEFLKQAKTALTTGDVDGAHNLALKAHVLLGELNQ